MTKSNGEEYLIILIEVPKIKWINLKIAYFLEPFLEIGP
jgi:hypothetical protein